MNEMLTIANFEISERHRQARKDRLVRERRAAGFPSEPGSGSRSGGLGDLIAWMTRGLTRATT